MSKHEWSNGVCLYEAASAFKCRRCGAEVISVEPAPTDEELGDAKLPLDCDEAVLTVIHEEYVDASGIGPWDDGHVHSWDK